MNALYLRQPGDVIAHYRIQRLLGSGSEGHVYVARDLRDGALRTFKLLRGREMIADSRHTVAYYRRLSTVSSVKRLIEWGIVSGQRSVGERPWMAFEFVRGRTLAEKIDAGHIQSSVHVLKAVCDALAPIHRLGLAVGDFDRERNLVIERGSGRVRFVDLDAGTPIDPPPTPADDLAELRRLSTRLMKSREIWAGRAVVDVVAESSSVAEIRRGLRALSSEA